MNQFIKSMAHGIISLIHKMGPTVAHFIVIDYRSTMCIIT